MNNDMSPTPYLKPCANTGCDVQHNRAGDFCSDACYRIVHKAHRKPKQKKAESQPKKEKRDYRKAILSCVGGDHRYHSPEAPAKMVQEDMGL